MSKTKILFVGNSLSMFTGLSYVAASMMKRFFDTGNYEIFHGVLAGPENQPQHFQVFGQDFVEKFQGLRSFNIQYQIEQTFNQFDRVIEQIRPDIVFCICDIWILEAIIYSVYRNSFLLFVYATIETPFYPEFAMFPTLFNNNVRKSLKDLFMRVDVLIPVTNMGKHAILNMGVNHNLTQNVYNGIDFDKRCTQSLKKQEIFGGTVKNDDFLFMHVSENSDRKILDRLIETFRVFLERVEDKSKYKLYLHTNFAEVKGGTDLISLILNSKLQDNILLPQVFLTDEFMTSEQLYMRYKTADCYISLTGGEGMGLGICEAMMHGLPVIYQDYGAPSEYMKGIGFPVKPQTFINAKNVDIKWALSDIENAVEQMLFVIENPVIAKEIASDAVEFAKNNLDWSVIFPKIQSIVEEKLSIYDKSPVLLRQIV